MITSSLALNSKVVQKPGNIVSDMDGDKVMLSVEQGKYYNLGSIGGDIWDLMDSPIRIDAIIINLLSNYEVEETTCQDHVLAFVSRLLEEGLAVIQE